jgi:GR25 family glycosyltransferase involved in LPS biosynthesis
MKRCCGGLEIQSWSSEENKGKVKMQNAKVKKEKDEDRARARSRKTEEKRKAFYFFLFPSFVNVPGSLFVFLSFCILTFAFCLSPLQAGIEKHLKKVEHKVSPYQVRQVDYIYLINLDQRPDKFEKCKWQLAGYNINPCRFSAVLGWTLSPEVLNEVGLKFAAGMEGDQWVSFYSPQGKGEREVDFLRETCVGKTYFQLPMTKGAIGCTLSHLSVLQDAYDSGYETIWIMEDDIYVSENPHNITAIIEKLDKLAEKPWDVLYTDIDIADRPLYYYPNDFVSDLKSVGWPWRPDVPGVSQVQLSKRIRMSDELMKIGFRMRTHSMIVRRSGMKKILDFFKTHGIFSGYDYELALVPDIQLYSLTYNLVTHIIFATSDTHNNNFNNAN